MVNRSLNFLDARNVVAAHDQREVGQSAAQDFAAVVAEQRDGEQVALARFFKRHDDVARAAAGGDSDGDVFGPRLRDELAQKDELGADVVGDRQ